MMYNLGIIYLFIGPLIPLKVQDCGTIAVQVVVYMGDRLNIVVNKTAFMKHVTMLFDNHASLLYNHEP